ncbi:hypothetical protein [Shewanella canadensis]|nr:hypothetical protein [Shewanella canadensis]
MLLYENMAPLPVRSELLLVAAATCITAKGTMPPSYIAAKDALQLKTLS